MNTLTFALLSVLAAAGDQLGPGDHERLLQIGDLHRSYTIHVPAHYDAKRPTPLVLALHGAGTNGLMMANYTGLSKKADDAGFIVVYPNGTGAGGLLLTWNSGGMPSKVDDVGYLRKVLDDAASCVNVDQQRIYATGLSNGAMMCYRLANEMSDRIAAIAPVAGTLAIDNYRPKRAVPVIHFHGTDDKLVPIEGPKNAAPSGFGFKSVPQTIRIVADYNHCAKDPQVTELPDTAHDGTKVTRKVYAPKEGRAEVVVYLIDGGGHTWPGHEMPIKFLGKTTKQISANDLLWEFFEKHPLK
jgi:polyhydroxybutyrate depolymerase